jgi:hypothetical protein
LLKKNESLRSHWLLGSGFTVLVFAMIDFGVPDAFPFCSILLNPTYQSRELLVPMG